MAAIFHHQNLLLDDPEVVSGLQFDDLESMLENCFLLATDAEANKVRVNCMRTLKLFASTPHGA